MTSIAGGTGSRTTTRKGCFCPTPEIGEAVQQNNRRQVTGPYVMQRDVGDLGVARPMVAALVQHGPPCVLTSTGRSVGNSMWLRLIHRARETPWSSLPRSQPIGARSRGRSRIRFFTLNVEPAWAPLLIAAAWLDAIGYAPGLRNRVSIRSMALARCPWLAAGRLQPSRHGPERFRRQSSQARPGTGFMPVLAEPCVRFPNRRDQTTGPQEEPPRSACVTCSEVKGDLANSKAHRCESTSFAQPQAGWRSASAASCGHQAH